LHLPSPHKVRFDSGRFGRALVVILAAVDLFSPKATADDQLEPDRAPGLPLDRLLEHWRERQNSVRSAKFVWSHEKHIRGQSYTNTRGQRFPSRDLKLDIHDIVFAYDQKRMAFWYYAPVLLDGAVPNGKSATVFDGTVAAAFHPPEEPGVDPPSAIFFDAARYTDTGNNSIWPFLLAFRPFGESGVNIDPQSLESTGEIVNINGTDCETILWHREHGDALLRVDANIGYLVRSYEFFLSGDPIAGRAPMLSTELRIDYAERSGFLVPDRWSLVFYDKPSMAKTRTFARLTSAVVNEALDDALFTVLPLPEGTIITDERDNTRWRVGANGARELLGVQSLEPVPEVAGEGGLLRTVIILAVNLAAFAILAALYWQRRKRQRES